MLPLSLSYNEQISYCPIINISAASFDKQIVMHKQNQNLVSSWSTRFYSWLLQTEYLVKKNDEWLPHLKKGFFFT